MKLATANKVGARRRTDEALEAQLIRLSRRNAQLKKEIARLEAYRAMAYRDPLTALWNRRYFDERLKEEISRSQRAGGGRRFSVMVVDINDFKAINDTYGHQAGDVALRWVAAFLTTHLRTHDVPCRTGGDEFMVLLPDLSAEDCGRIVVRLRLQLRVANSTRAVPLNLSLGTASWPDSGVTAEQVVAQADQAMYGDKRRQKAGAPERDAPAAEAARPERARQRLRTIPFA